MHSHIVDTQSILAFLLSCTFPCSDQVKSMCKIRDEYLSVKDLVSPKETLTSTRNPVTGAYPSNQGTV